MENKCQDVPKLEHLYTADGYVKWCNCNRKHFGSFAKGKHRMTIGLKNSSPRFISKGIENKYSNKYLCKVFIAALFTIVKKWKQPKSSSKDKWINKMLYIHTMEYYSDIKQN